MKKRSSAVLFLSLAAMGCFLILTAAGSHFLSMEAKNGVDFNLRSIQPLVVRAEEGDRISVEFDVYTRVPGIYGLKVFSPTGTELASEMKLVRDENPGIWKLTSEFENAGFGRYEIELFGFFNVHENQFYRTYFWIEDAAEVQAPVPGKNPSGRNFPETAASEISDSPASSSANPPADARSESGHSLDGGENYTSLTGGDEESIYEKNSSPEPASGQVTKNPVYSGNGSPVETGVNRSSGPAHETGTLYISSILTGSTIYLKGHEMGRTPETLTDLPAGTYSLRLPFTDTNLLKPK